MRIPIIYNLLSLKERWTSTIVAVLGIAGTVGVFIAMLSLARGFRASLVSSGSQDNAIIMRADANTEIGSAIDLDSVKIIQDAPGVARVRGLPLVTAEVVVVGTFPLRATGSDANAQIRGVSSNVFDIRKNISIAEGRMFTPGLPELLVGKNASSTYKNLRLGDRVDFGGGHWVIVGVFDAKGSSFDSEIWCDSRMLAQMYKQPDNIFQSATVHLASAVAFKQFKDAIGADPRLKVSVRREIDYYSDQSKVLTILITVLGGVLAAIMAIGAVLGALNTMYSTVSDRGREIATIRALGFTGGSVLASFLVEALVTAFIGGIIGCLAVLPLNGLTTGTMNWQTFSRLAFAFKVTPDLLVRGIVFALVMGVLGGITPAIRAATRPVAPALRG